MTFSTSLLAFSFAFLQRCFVSSSAAEVADLHLHAQLVKLEGFYMSRETLTSPFQ